MADKVIREVLGDGVHFTSIRDRKFKHNRIGAYFILPLDSGTTPDYAMVPLMLRKGSRTVATMQKLNAKLNELYGANLSINISKFNRYQCIGLGISFLDNRYAMDGENLIAQCTQLILDLLLDPNLEGDGYFSQKNFSLERQYLLDSIEGEINDKRGYAVDRASELMCEGDPIALPRYGTKETALSVTRESVTKAWETMLETARVELIFSGSGSGDDCKKSFANAFEGIKRTPMNYALAPLSGEVASVKEETEEMGDIQQAKLVMGFRLPKLETREEKDTARVFGAIFGGTPFSKLFLNVREKLSLCYYCAARVSAINGIMTVDSGLEVKNANLAKEEILNQLSLIARGEVSDEEMDNTKKLLATMVQNTQDSLGGLESWYLNQGLVGESISPSEDVENLGKVTKEDVINLAKKIALDTVYLLSGKEG